jgi:type VI protein secretion system component VasK
LEFRAPTEEEWNDRRRVLYTELAQTPPLMRRLGLVLDRRGVMSLMLLVAGIVAVIVAGTVAEALTYPQSERATIRLLTTLSGLVWILVGLVGLGQRLLAVDRFFEFRRERLRDAYVRDLPLERLLEVNHILDEALDLQGPVRGRRLASEVLSRRGLYAVSDTTGLAQ